MGRVVSWSRRLVTSAAFALALLLPRGAPATPPAPEPMPLSMRLDDAADLPLLAPFRHAAGLSWRGRYLAGPHGRWHQRSWQTLDWEALLPHSTLTTSTPPISPRPRAAVGRPCLSRLTEEAWGWPFVVGDGHFFVREPRPGALYANTVQLGSLSTALLPPWLQRVDRSWAHALVLVAGCGRGGPCSPGTLFPAEVFVALWQALNPPLPPPPWWECRERPVRVMRYGREQDTFVLLGCDGRVPADALERLSLLARPLDVERPTALPPQRDVRAGRGEWAPGIRLLHPRLLWLLHRVALEFPWRAIYLFSGYRPSSEPLTPGGHRSNHALGRALDIAVQDVASEELLSLCHALPDVGCGYYPNNKFVHVDVRTRGRGKGLWVDSSAPGAPSRYLDGWPGVVEGGTVVWRKAQNNVE